MLLKNFNLKNGVKKPKTPKTNYSKPNTLI
jgi:hypothetical protein